VATGNLYELTAYGRIGNQDCISVFHYLQVSGAGDADRLNLAFVGDVIPYFQDVQTAGFEWLSLTAKDKADPTDFDILPILLPGHSSGDSSLPTHVTWSWTYISNRLDARSGGKRISGIGEAMISSGVATGAYLTRVIGLESVLESPISDGADVFRPVIYGKRLGSVGFFSNPLSGVSYLGITSQNSRKFYTSPGL